MAALLFSGKPSALVPAAHHRVRRYSNYLSLAPIRKGAYARQRGIGHPQEPLQASPTCTNSIISTCNTLVPETRGMVCRLAWLTCPLRVWTYEYEYSIRVTPCEFNLF